MVYIRNSLIENHVCLTHETSLYNFEMNWSPWEVLHLGQVKFVNCPGNVEDENFIVKFHMTFTGRKVNAIEENWAKMVYIRKSLIEDELSLKFTIKKVNTENMFRLLQWANSFWSINNYRIYLSQK